MSARGQLGVTGLSGAIVMPHTTGSARPRGGRYLPVPVPTNQTVQVRATDDPATDRYLFLRTAWRSPGYVYQVGLVDGFNRPTEPAKHYPTLNKARAAANRKYDRLTAQED